MATINYNGMELEEITTPYIDNLPKKMLVWGHGVPFERTVCATAIDNFGELFFIARGENEKRGGVDVWKHCAEIPEEPKPRRVTNRELAEWLARGNGQVSYFNENGYGCVSSSWTYMNGDPASPTDEGNNKDLSIRRWGDTEWHDLDAEYMEVKR